MTPLARGLYERLITQALEAELRTLASSWYVETRALELGEVADRLALHVGSVLRRALEDVADDDRVRLGTTLARQLIARIVDDLDLNVASEQPVEPGKLLAAILQKQPDGSPAPINAPLIPLLDTTLLTNSPDEPRVGSQILAEIDSADAIDVVIAFIRRSGIRPLRAALERCARDGRRLRVLTTTYTGSTEADALDDLRALGAEVRVSYDTKSTRLHAKAWLFHRRSGFSTAYIGSSNLTHSAQITGLEWNMRVSAARNLDVLRKVEAVFEAYWESGEFVPYDRAIFEAQIQPRTTPTTRLSPLEFRLEPFQHRMLEQIALARSQGHHRNLLVSATGTGKTVMAAVDYDRLRGVLPRDRLLFIAHRQEILEQSLHTFRHVMHDGSFGELWVGSARPTRFDHVFASIQSLSRVSVEHLAPEHFDVVIVDEFHHAAASSYARLLAHIHPRELLGLTATPERSDGLSILEHFDGRIAAEMRLWQAIDQQRLVPFLYFGVHDGLNLTNVPWRRGRGYDVDALTNVITSDAHWARLVLEQLRLHVDDIKRIRCLGFCVSVAHARFMERVFRDAGVNAKAIWGDSTEEERAQALRDLAGGAIQVLFSVDLFNEGVDVPTVDTLLLLRPTDSPTLFLQQLGRGLRRAPNKVACTVLDFVGTHRKEFRMDRRFRALIGGSRAELARAIERGFPFLPAGCHLELDAVASQHVLANIKASIPTRWREKVAELKQIAASDPSVTLSKFLEESGLELDELYAGDKCWSDLRQDAGLPVEPPGRHERSLRRALTRLLHIDDVERIRGYRDLLKLPSAPRVNLMGVRDVRRLQMLVASLVDQVANATSDLQTGADVVWEHPQVREELKELLTRLEHEVTHLTIPLDAPADVPLQVHARYTRLEILAAIGRYPGRAVLPSWQAGVCFAEESRIDAFAFTLDKTDGHFSPTTRYRDYAISRELIHWESQSTTAQTSEMGRRYQEHVARGSHVLLFARHRRSDRAFHFLGPATYVSHESERPMAVKWKLHHPLPGDLFASFAAAVA